MKEKIVEPKYYKIAYKKGNHLNRKRNEDGSRSAVQFDDHNTLQGPVDLYEVDENELWKAHENGELNPIIKYIIDSILAPYITEQLNMGADQFLTFLKKKAIPKTKESVKELTKNTGIYISAFRDALTGKEPKAVQLLREEAIKIGDEKYSIMPDLAAIDMNKENKSIEEIQQIIDIMRINAISLASCIRFLSNVIITNTDKNQETALEMKKEIEKLSSEEILNQIGFLLEDKHQNFLYESTRKILSAFREGQLIIEDKMVPICNLLPDKIY